MSENFLFKGVKTLNWYVVLITRTYTHWPLKVTTVNLMGHTSAVDSRLLVLAALSQRCIILSGGKQFGIPFVTFHYCSAKLTIFQLKWMPSVSDTENILRFENDFDWRTVAWMCWSCTCVQWHWINQLQCHFSLLICQPVCFPVCIRMKSSLTVWKERTQTHCISPQWLLFCAWTPA